MVVTHCLHIGSLAFKSCVATEHGELGGAAAPTSSVACLRSEMSTPDASQSFMSHLEQTRRDDEGPVTTPPMNPVDVARPQGSTVPPSASNDVVEQRLESYKAVKKLDITTPKRPTPQARPMATPVLPPGPSPFKGLPPPVTCTDERKPRWVPPALVRVNTDDGAIANDAVALIAGWLQDHGLPTTMRTLRHEASMHHREQYSFRKSLRSMALAVTNGSWDVAHQIAKDLFAGSVNRGDVAAAHRREELSPSALSKQTTSQAESAESVDNATAAAGVRAADRRVGLMLYEQQLLELVDCGDSTKAFTLFMRAIKPLQQLMPRTHFERLSYSVTCRSVAELASKYPELAHWSIAASRAALVTLLREELKASHAASNGEEGNVLITDTYVTPHAPNGVPKALDNMFEEAASFQLLRAAAMRGATPSEVYACLTSAEPPAALYSLMRGLTAHAPSHARLADISLPQQRDAVRVVRFLPRTRAVVCGMASGALATVPLALTSDGTFSSPADGPSILPLGHHNGAVTGIAYHEMAVTAVVLSTGADGVARLWNPVHRMCLHSFGHDVHNGTPLTACALSVDGATAVLGDTTGRVSIWSSGKGDNRYRHDPTNPRSGMPTSLLTTLWAPGEPMPRRPSGIGFVMPQLLHTVAEPRIGGADVAPEAHRANTVVSIIVPRHGLHVYIGRSDGSLVVISTVLGQVLRTFDEPRKVGRAVAFTLAHSGLHAFIADADGTARVLCLTDGSMAPDEFVTAPPNNDSSRIVLRNELSAMAVSADDRLLLGATTSGEVLVWSTVERAELNVTVKRGAMVQHSPLYRIAAARPGVALVDLAVADVVRCTGAGGPQELDSTLYVACTAENRVLVIGGAPAPVSAA